MDKLRLLDTKSGGAGVGAKKRRGAIPRPFLQLLFLLSTLTNLGLAAQLKPVSVTMGGKTGTLESADGPLLLGVKPDSGPSRCVACEPRVLLSPIH